MHVEAKKKKKEEHKKICLDGMGINKKEKDNVEKVGDDAGWEDVPDDDAQYYRDEVGEEPDAGENNMQFKCFHFISDTHKSLISFCTSYLEFLPSRSLLLLLWVFGEFIV